MVTNIIEQLQRDEGLRLEVYLDQVGKRTIGYGHNLDANPLPDDTSNGITEERAAEILVKDIAHVTAHLQIELPWVSSLSEPRQGVLINMGFNMGVPTLLKFHHTLAAVEAGDYTTAARHMEASAWYTEVGPRAIRLVGQMEFDQWA